MNLDDAIVLETFSNRIEAEMAAGLLESEGIEAMVMADDAGGTYPMLQFIRGVRLVVFKEDEARAKEILADMAAGGGSRRRTLIFSTVRFPFSVLRVKNISDINRLGEMVCVS